MSNILNNGTVLPSGLLSAQSSSVSAFNRSYSDTRLKAGVVIKSYAVSDPQNQNGLCTEYDVMTIEQFENKGSTNILYRNCMSGQGFGGIADYFEYTLRPKTKQTNKGTTTFAGQDGAIVMIQCLDGIGGRAIVIGNLSHPDRPTNITSGAPQMSGEYNGVKISINNDGSCSLVFNGATDSMGASISSPGPTTFSVAPDGSFEFNHSAVSIKAEKSGMLTITATADVNIACVNANLNASGDTNISCVNTNLNASGDAKLVVGGMCAVKSSGKTTVDAATVELNGSSGQVLTNITDPQVDSIFGQPTVGVPTVKAG